VIISFIFSCVIATYFVLWFNKKFFLQEIRILWLVKNLFWILCWASLRDIAV
jgi:hypothetical protein